MNSTKQNYKKGLRDGFSIGLGYFAVSFSFGIIAVQSGLTVFQSTIISMTSMTSAGQFAGLKSIVASSSIISFLLTQLVINLRYSLMSLALSQKLDSSVGFFKRCIIATFNTDENFAVAMGQSEPIKLNYILGLATFPWYGWASGTFFGAYAGEILPIGITTALGVALYAMFIAIVVPSIKGDKSILYCVLLAALLSSVCAFCLPMIKDFSIILCTVIASSVMAIIFPKKNNDQAQSSNEASANLKGEM